MSLPFCELPNEIHRQRHTEYKCHLQSDYQGSYTYIGPNAKVDPIDDYECQFEATGGHNMWK